MQEMGVDLRFEEKIVGLHLLFFELEGALFQYFLVGGLPFLLIELAGHCSDDQGEKQLKECAKAVGKDLHADIESDLILFLFCCHVVYEVECKAAGREDQDGQEV